MNECASCHAVNDPEDAFCAQCGSRLTAEVDGLAATTSGPSSVETTQITKPAAPAQATHSGPVVHEPYDLGDAALLGSGQPNAAYLGQRLTWEHTESFDITGALMRAIATSSMRGMVLQFAVVFGAIGGIVVDLVLGHIVVVLYLIAVGAACVFVWVVPFFRRHYFPINEWKLGLDGKGANADAVFEHIAGAVIRRQLPVQYRIVTLPDGQEYLNLRLDRYEAYVTTMAFGNDLYIGWSLWASGTWSDLRAGRPNFFKMLLGLPYWAWIDFQTSREGRSFDVATIHQYDVIKAMREFVHAVTREGVQAATGSVDFVSLGTIGSPIPRGREPEFAGRSMALRG